MTPPTNISLCPLHGGLLRGVDFETCTACGSTAISVPLPTDPRATEHLVAYTFLSGAARFEMMLTTDQSRDSASLISLDRGRRLTVDGRTLRIIRRPDLDQYPDQVTWRFLENLAPPGGHGGREDGLSVWPGAAFEILIGAKASNPPSDGTSSRPIAEGRPKLVIASGLFPLDALSAAHRLLKDGRQLWTIGPAAFEQLLRELLDGDGWTILKRRKRKKGDGGVDVYARREDPEIGLVSAIWQAKCHSPGHKVELDTVREMGRVRQDEGASKVVIATTTRLSSGALAYVRQNRYEYGWKDGPAVEAWIRSQIARRR